jgi:hypothetical protein
MAYVDDRINLWKYEQAQSQDTRDKLNNALNTVAGNIKEDRARALATKRANDAQALALSKDGVSADDITAYQNDGDMSGIQRFYGGLHQRSQAQKDLERERLLQDRELDRRYKESQIYKNTADAKKNEAKTNDAGAPNEELVIPGMGAVRTKKEAVEIRSAKADAADAMRIIDEIKKHGTDVSIFDRERVNKIDQLKKVLAGKLRLPLTGPGAMTEDEYQRLIDTMGDPTSLFSTEKIQHAKLDQLKDILNNSVYSKFNAATTGPALKPKSEQDELAELEMLRSKKAGQPIGGQ